LELYGSIPVGVTLDEVEAEMTPEGGFNEVAPHVDDSKDEDTTTYVSECDRERYSV
jgi:hypothetical protein